MRLLTCTKLGANIYITMIRSKINYGCEVYNSASYTTKKILDKTQAQSLRICTGSHKSASIHGMQVEMGDPPYEEKLQCLITKSYLNIMSHNDTHPTKNHPIKQQHMNIFPQKKNQG